MRSSNTNNITQIWDAILNNVRLNVTHASFETYFKSLKLTKMERGHLTVEVSRAFSRTHTGKQLKSEIKHAAEKALGHPVEITFITPLVNKSPTTAANTSSSKRNVQGRSSINPNMSFETFANGASNSLALDASLKLLDPNEDDFNPLFIHANYACGKTHLLHALGNRITGDGVSAFYIGAEKFIRDYVKAARTKSIREEREKFDTIQCLLIDDIQYMEGKTKTLEFLSHIVNDAHIYQRQIVITSDRSIANLNFPPMLKSRLAQGLEVEIEALDLETRLNILDKFARGKGLKLTEDVMNLLAHANQFNLRELRGVVNKISLHLRSTRKEVTVESVSRIISTSVNRIEVVRSTPPADVIDAVSQITGVPSKDIIGRKRTQKISFARKAAIYFMRNYCDMSLAEIGSRLGDRGHQTIQHSYRVFERLAKDDKKVSKDLLDIQREVTRMSKSG